MAEQEKEGENNTMLDVKGNLNTMVPRENQVPRKQ